MLNAGAHRPLSVAHNVAEVLFDHVWRYIRANPLPYLCGRGQHVIPGSRVSSLTSLSPRVIYRVAQKASPLSKFHINKSCQNLPVRLGSFSSNLSIKEASEYQKLVLNTTDDVIFVVVNYRT